MSAIDKIEHVVVLILENHSFDQMLGCMSAVWPELDGIDPNNSNADAGGNVFHQTATSERQMTHDPRHEVEHVAIQLENGNGGFVRDFVASYTDPVPSATERQYILGYYPLDFLPGLHQLARHYTVCDHWFSSLPGPTWPNRFFALSGTALGRVDMPGDGTHKIDLPGFFAQTQDTIFDRLNEKMVDWKVYFHDIPQSWVLKQLRAPHNAAKYFYINQFYDDARGIPDDFPQFSLIEPDYFGFKENDDHPPHDAMKAEKLIADVYNALRGNKDLWRSTLLVVFYDEHGGFYDHVMPPAAVPPDAHVAKVKYLDGVTRDFCFDQLGLRVPAILASPWVKAGVEKMQFDHTSVLKFVTEKWGLRPLDSARVAAANSIGVALTRGRPRLNVLDRIVLTDAQLTPPDPHLEEAAVAVVSDHHKALKKLAQFLPSALWERTKKEVDTLAPQFYTGWARWREGGKAWLAAGLDWLRGWCEYRLADLYETREHKVVISEPDKVDLKFARERNHVVRFLATQKPRAIKGLEKRIDQPDKYVNAQWPAAKTLSALTDRQFHRYQGHASHAKAWLQRRKTPNGASETSSATRRRVDAG